MSRHILPSSKNVSPASVSNRQLASEYEFRDGWDFEDDSGITAARGLKVHVGDNVETYSAVVQKRIPSVGF
jgi:hypothetical protein